MNQDRSSIQRGIELHKAGRLAEAEAVYLSLLRVRCSDADALHFLGLLRMHQGRRLAAIELMQRSVIILPDNPHAWNNLGNVLLAENRDDEAEAAYIRASHLSPRMAEAWFNLGILFRRKRRPEDALKSFRRVIDSNPRFSGAYEQLGMLLYRMGRADHAADVYRKWVAVEPSNPLALHMWSATSGEAVPKRAADSYVSKLFDGFAESFDSSLKDLAYAAPELLSAALAERVDFGNGRLDVLDAGCGTGLCGLLLRSTAKKLVGVDLSAGMLAKARERHVYDELIEAELCSFMRSRPGEFDVVNCADTLVYFGDLEEALGAASICLKAHGVFGFTVEADSSDEKPYSIQTHGRYSHAAGYVISSMHSSGFEDVEREAVVLRKERGEDVHGHLVTGRSPG